MADDWISCKIALPSDNRICFVGVSCSDVCGYSYITTASYDKDGWYDKNGDSFKEKVLCWMERDPTFWVPYCTHYKRKENKMSEWISVKDKLPEDDKIVLIFVSYSTFVGTSRIDYNYIAFGKYYMDNVHDGHEWWKLHEEKDCSINSDWVKYWMPFPEPPEKYTGER